MRIDVVDPREHRVRRIQALDPAQRGVGGEPGRADVAPNVVHREAAIEVSAREHLVRHHGDRLVAGIRHHLCEGHDVRRQAIGQRPDARRVRVGAGEQRRQRRRGARYRCDRLLEVEASGDQRVEDGRRRPVVAVHAHVVGAQRVDGQQQDARRPRDGPVAREEREREQCGPDGAPAEHGPERIDFRASTRAGRCF